MNITTHQTFIPDLESGMKLLSSGRERLGNMEGIDMPPIPLDFFVGPLRKALKLLGPVVVPAAEGQGLVQGNPYLAEVHLAGDLNRWLNADTGYVHPTPESRMAYHPIFGVYYWPHPVREDMEFKPLVVSGLPDHKNYGGRQKATWIDCPRYGFGFFKNTKGNNWVYEI